MWASLLISFQWKDFVKEGAAAEFSDTSSSRAYWFQFSNIILTISIMIGKKVTENRKKSFSKQPSSHYAPLFTWDIIAGGGVWGRL